MWIYDTWTRDRDRDRDRCTEVHRAQNYVSGITISQNEQCDLRQNSDRPVSSEIEYIYMVHGHIED